MIDPTQEELYCVYKITNTINNKLYIGITNCLQYRWHTHRTASRKGKSPLYQEMRLYGRDKFIIEAIEENIRSSIANDREAYWIDYFNSASPHGYNTDLGSRKRLRIREATLDDDTARRPAIKKGHDHEQ